MAEMAHADGWMTDVERRGGKSARTKVAVVMLLLVIVAVAGVAAAIQFVSDQAEHDLLGWQARLALVADGRAHDVDQWLAEEGDEIAQIAHNPSVALLFSQLEDVNGDRSQIADFDGQAAYLRNYLESVAERAGFVRASAFDFEANVPGRAPIGIAVLDAEGHIVTTTREMGDPAQIVAPMLADGAFVEPRFVDALTLSDDTVAFGFIAPVIRLQSDASLDNVVGYVLGLRPLDEAVFSMLRQPGDPHLTAETVLVRAANGNVEYLSPTRGGGDSTTPPLGLGLDADTENLAAAAAIREAGAFGQFIDYRGVDVLAISRALNAAPWTLVYKVDRGEALADSDARLQRLLILLVLAVAIAAVCMFALWRHGASQRTAHALDRLQATTDRLAQQERFLRLVTDAQPSSMFVADEQGQFQFANATLATRLKSSIADIVGAPMSRLFGAAQARALALHHDEAREANAVVTTIREVVLDDETRTYQAAHIPMGAMLPNWPGAVLTVEEDISEAMAERERNERILDGLVETLVTVIDARDPHAARHSVHVGHVAEAIAKEMGADDTTVETAAYAGRLLNLGKIMVPSELLTLERDLGPEEIRQIREGIMASARFIEGVEFRGPVVETVRQALEHVDGTGLPQGLRGDAILPAARIVAVANAFVAMVSPRAHRAGKTIDEALAQITAGIDHAFDRAAVSALVNYMENRGGRDAVAAWTR